MTRRWASAPASPEDLTGLASGRLRVRALAAAPATGGWLCRGRSARVLGLFERACNLVDGRGRVLSLVLSEADLAPFGLALDWPGGSFLQVVRPGDVARADAGELRLGSLRVDLSTARPWQPAPDWPGLRRALPGFGAGLEAVAHVLTEHAPPGSLPFLLDGRAPGGLISDRLRRGAALVAQGLRARRAADCAEGARLLAGLGAGLTPAGDDFLAGACLAAWAGLPAPEAAALAGILAETAAPRTTTLSAAFLRAAARGECSARWQALFSALRSGQAGRVPAAARSLVAVGHTSGADALAGFVTCGGARSSDTRSSGCKDSPDFPASLPRRGEPPCQYNPITLPKES